MQELSNPLNVQVGGSHYKNSTYQPIEFICKYNLNFIQGNVVKYLCRYKHKNGVEDLCKVLHYARLANTLKPSNFSPTIPTLQYLKFAESNNVSMGVLEIIVNAVNDTWSKVIILVEDLIEKEYACKKEDGEKSSTKV